MRILTKPWILFPAIAVAVGCFAFFASRHQRMSNADLVRLLPRSGNTVFFANFALLRRAGMLKLLSSTGQDPEYRKFVRQTDFDYSRDIDALAGAYTGSDLLFAIRGRFDWQSLRGYAMSHGGYCKGRLCRVPTSTPGRWASFRPIQSDVMGLRLGPKISPEPNSYLAGNKPIPQAPVWVELSPKLLRNTERLPEGVRLFASAFEPARSVVFSLTAAPNNSGNAFEVRLDAQCASPATAKAIANQLRLDTKLLKLILGRKHKAAEPDNLIGMALSGEFYISGRNAVGVWPVSKALLHSLE